MPVHRQNSGQERPFIMSTRSRIGIAFLLTAAVITAGLWLDRELSIDSCLDRGGSWNHEHSECIMSKP
jgi:hypothetical protein